MMTRVTCHRSKLVRLTHGEQASERAADVGECATGDEPHLDESTDEEGIEGKEQDPAEDMGDGGMLEMQSEGGTAAGFGVHGERKKKRVVWIWAAGL